jgi:hypothetical protein
MCCNSALAAKGFREEVVDEAAAECDIVWSDPLKQELESLLTRLHKIGVRSAETQKGSRNYTKKLRIRKGQGGTRW